MRSNAAAGAEGGGQRARRQPEGNKSVFLAYLLAVCGGWLGLQHLYLDRPLHALLWACSWGGLGCGLLRDLLRLPAYTAACNGGPKAEDELALEMKYSKVPPWSPSRLFGACLFGYWFGWVASLAGPEFMPEGYFLATSALGTALGVWMVGIACTHQGGSLGWTCAASVLGTGAGYPVVASLLAFQWTRRWEPEPRKWRPRRWQVISAAGLFWLVLVGGVLEHASITADLASGEGKRIYKLRECVWNILRSVDFSDFSESFKEGAGEEDWGKKWQKSWDSLKGNLDVGGERHALRTLGMSEFIGKSYTEEDVKRNYKKMAMRWHPDRAGSDKKEEAEKRMAEINEAKGALDKILQGGSRHGKKRS